MQALRGACSRITIGIFARRNVFLGAFQHGPTFEFK